MPPIESFTVASTDPEGRPFYAEQFTRRVDGQLAEIAAQGGKFVSATMVELATHRYMPPTVIPHLLILAGMPAANRPERLELDNEVGARPAWEPELPGSGIDLG